MLIFDLSFRVLYEKICMYGWACKELKMFLLLLKLKSNKNT